MSPTQWMVQPLKKYADFQGRASRPEYWWFFLLFVIVYGVASLVGDWLGVIVGLALLVPSVAVGVRRFHDQDKTGWLVLLGLIPLLGVLILIYFYIQPGTPGPNRFGADPRGNQTVADAVQS